MKRAGKSKVVEKSASAGKGKATGKFASAGKFKPKGKYPVRDKNSDGSEGKATIKGKPVRGAKKVEKDYSEGAEKKIKKTYGVEGSAKSTFRSKSKGPAKTVDNGYDAGAEHKFAKQYGDKPKGKMSSKAPKATDSMRLNRFLANAGICSRREADKYIEAGIVTINGIVVTELGTKVKFDDNVKFNDAPLVQEKKTYILLNKPKDYVTTLDDPHAKKTVIDLIKNGCKVRVYPVGRLDKATTGLLLLTNDGDLSEFLTHPRNNKKKIYQVTLNKPATTQDLQTLLEGVKLEDGVAKADEITFVDQVDKSVIGIEIHSGKNRIVRRMFEHLGYDVKKLDRVYFAGLTKKNLPRGKWRFLSDKEITMLKRGIFA